MLRRPDIRSAESKVVAESARIGVAVADLYPQLSLTGAISIDSTDIPSLFTPHVGRARPQRLGYGRPCPLRRPTIKTSMTPVQASAEVVGSGTRIPCSWRSKLRSLLLALN